MTRGVYFQFINIKGLLLQHRIKLEHGADPLTLTTGYKP